jgi:hypothetical protein
MKQGLLQKTRVKIGKFLIIASPPAPSPEREGKNAKYEVSGPIVSMLKLHY